MQAPVPQGGHEGTQQGEEGHGEGRDKGGMVGLEKKKKKQMKSWRGLGERSSSFILIKQKEGTEEGDTPCPLSAAHWLWSPPP